MMVRVKRCSICGARMPRSAVKKGWRIVRLFRPGLGTRWYRHCGYCCSASSFYDVLDELHEQGRDHTRQAFRIERMLLFR